MVFCVLTEHYSDLIAVPKQEAPHPKTPFGTVTKVALTLAWSWRTLCQRHGALSNDVPSLTLLLLLPLFYSELCPMISPPPHDSVASRLAVRRLGISSLFALLPGGAGVAFLHAKSNNTPWALSFQGVNSYTNP